MISVVAAGRSGVTMAMNDFQGEGERPCAASHCFSSSSGVSVTACDSRSLRQPDCTAETGKYMTTNSRLESTPADNTSMWLNGLSLGNVQLAVTAGVHLGERAIPQLYCVNISSSSKTSRIAQLYKDI